MERTSEWERKEAIRLQQEKQRKHIKSIAAAVQARKTALLKATENWRLNQSVLNFIEDCEMRWKSQSPELSSKQRTWLTWARKIATAISPYSAGYPDPAIDGAFDPNSIPFGGPYPPVRKFNNLPSP